MGLVVSGICLALHDDKTMDEVKIKIAAYNNADPKYKMAKRTNSFMAMVAKAPNNKRVGPEKELASVYGGPDSRRRFNVLEAVTPSMRHLSTCSPTKKLIISKSDGSKSDPNVLSPMKNSG